MTHGAPPYTSPERTRLDGMLTKWSTVEGVATIKIARPTVGTQDSAQIRKRRGFWLATRIKMGVLNTDRLPTIPMGQEEVKNTLKKRMSVRGRGDP